HGPCGRVHEVLLERPRRARYWAPLLPAGDGFRGVSFLTGVFLPGGGFDRMRWLAAVESADLPTAWFAAASCVRGSSGPLAGGIGILCWSIFGMPYRLRSTCTLSICVACPRASTA